MLGSTSNLSFCPPANSVINLISTYLFQRKMMRGSEEGDDVWPVPKAIGEVVKKLRNHLENDIDSFKGTMKMLGVLEDKIPLLCIGNLNVEADKEEDRAAWLRQVMTATEEAQELVHDMDNQVNILLFFPKKNLLVFQ